MPALARHHLTSAPIAARHSSLLAKRENWAKQEAGVVVVFCIVGIVVIGLIGYHASKFLSRTKAARQERAAKA